MSFESPIENIHRREERERSPEHHAEDINKAYDKALAVIAEKEIDPASFSDLYGNEVLEKDRAYVEKSEAFFKEQQEQNPDNGAQQERIKKAATVFEAMALEGIDEHEWLGPNARAIKTAPYDDYKNGVDMVVEAQRGDDPAEHFAFAVDVTFGKRAQEKKFQRIREEIENDKLGVVKYFASDRSNIRGELSNIPKVVIGLEPRNISKMSRLWLEQPERLKNHPSRIVILIEIKEQLEEFRQYAAAIGNTNAEKAYTRSLAYMNRILNREDEETRQQALTRYPDRVSDTLHSHVSEFRHEANRS